MSRAKSLLNTFNEARIGDDKTQHNDRFAVLGGGNAYLPTGKRQTAEKLTAGAYVPKMSPQGVVFEKAQINTDEILRFEDERQKKVVKRVEKFWEQGQRYNQFGFTHSFGLLMEGPPGSGKCLGRGTPVLMYDGSTKKVEDVVVGDKLMGDDSTPRTVKSTTSGYEQMYRVVPVKGDPYVVNESHILSLKMSCAAGGKEKGEKVDISVREYMERSNHFKHYAKGYRVGVDFEEKEVPLDPYYLGIWLGDGNNKDQSISNPEEEILEYLYSLGEERGLHVYADTQEGKCPLIKLVKKEGLYNNLLDSLRELELINNKHIPHIYKANSKENRLQLLAGLLDTDGYYCNGYYEIMSNNSVLKDDILYLAKSLGFAAYYKEKEAKLENWDEPRTYYRISISGHVDEIPCKVERKQAEPRKQKKDVLSTGITLEKLEVDEYFGFEIDGNRRFLLGDFTVTHNTVIVKQVLEDAINQDHIALICRNVDDLAEGLNALREVEPDRKILCVMEDIENLIKFGDQSLIQLMDGDNKQEGVFYLGTTNHPEKIHPRVKRKGRFSETIHVPFPPKEGRQAYLKKKLGQHEDAKEINRIVKATEGLSFAHLRDYIIGTYCEERNSDEVLSEIKDVSVEELKSQGLTYDEFKEKLEEALGVQSTASYNQSLNEDTVRTPSDKAKSKSQRRRMERMKSKYKKQKSESRASKLLEEMDDSGFSLIDPEEIKKEFRQKIKNFGIEGVNVEDVTVDMENDIIVNFSDDEGDELLAIFQHNEEEAWVLIVDDEEEAENEEGEAIIVDLSPLPFALRDTPIGKYLELATLEWMNKSTLVSILRAGEIGYDKQIKDYSNSYDAYGNRVVAPAEAKVSEEDLKKHLQESGVDELKRTVVRGGKRVKLPVVIKKKKKKLTGKQKAGIRKGARKRKAKKAQIQRKRKKSLKKRKQMGLKKGGLGTRRKLKGR